MEMLIAVLIVLQAIGAVIGAGGSVFAEFFYIRALKDLRVDQAEYDHLRVIGQTLRYGMFLVLFSSTGLAIVNFMQASPSQSALTPAYWIEVGLALLIIGMTSAMARKRMHFTLGSAIIFTAWWYIAFLTLGQLPALSFGASIALYVIATGLIAGILAYARMMLLRI